MASLSSPRQPTVRETATSFSVLAVLATVCVWLAFAQLRFSPAVTVAATAALSAEQAVAQRSGTPASIAAGAQPVSAQPPTSDLLRQWPDGLAAMSPAEGFTAETLSDKIDGKAELYLSAGVVAMRCQRVTAATAWFEAYAYDMGTAENAFSVYSSQKRSETKAGGIGDYSYVAGNQLCLVHGQYYVECIGADDSPAVLAGSLAFARAFIAATPVPRHANMTKDEALFPAEGLQPGSIMLMSADVFGFDQLTNTYVARYREGDGTFALFLTRRRNSIEATQLATAVRRFFVDDCGGTEVAATNASTGAAIVDEGGNFDAVFTSGAFVAGVHQAPTRDAAERSVQRLAAQLERAR